jgi:hypothetical protein
MVRERQNGSAFAISPTPSPKALLIPSEAENPRWKQRGFFSPRTYHSVMNQNDDKLRALLKQWRDIEPPGNFEANVWRRIRLAEAEKPERVSVIELFLRNWPYKPAMSIAAAVAASFILGLSLGVLTAPRSASTTPKELGFLSSGTLAGGYLRTAAGSAR